MAWSVEARPLASVESLTKHKIAVAPDRILGRGDVAAVDAAVRAVQALQVCSSARSSGVLCWLFPTCQCML